MSWICKNCETENSDILEVCEVCETHAPRILDFTYDKVLSDKPIEIRWKTEFCEHISIYYNGETIDVSEKDNFCLEYKDSPYISFLLSNSETTTRTVNYTMDFIESPTIHFSSNKSKLKKGQKESAIISWNIENSERAYLIIDDKRSEIPLNGETEVFTDVTIKYIIEAIALDDATPFIKELLIEVFEECVITFSADKQFVFPSLPVKLTWNVANAKKVWLGSEEVEPSGSKIVEPTSDTVYILQANDEFGMKNQRLTIQTLPLKQMRLTITPPPNFVSRQILKIQQPRYIAEVKFPHIDIDWIKIEEPRATSFKDLGINVELSPPLPKVSLIEKLIRVFNLTRR